MYKRHFFEDSHSSPAKKVTARQRSLTEKNKEKGKEVKKASSRKKSIGKKPVYAKSL